MSKSSKSKRKLILPQNPLGDMETWADALDMINLKWVSNPVNESGDRVENEVRFNKIKQLLDCAEMESAHDFLYSITDPDGVSDEIAQKIDDLYDLAVAQGFIEDMASDHEVEEAENDELDTSMNFSDDNTETGEAGDEVTATPDVDDEEHPEDGVGTNRAWTCLYSAIKPNGTIVTGEFYSNAVDTDSARADCISQMLGKFGMKSVEVLAVEAQDMDQIGNTSAEVETPDWANDEDWKDEDEVEEDNKASNGASNQVLLGEEGKPAEFKVEVTTLPSYGTGKSSGGTGGKASSCKVEGGAKKNSKPKSSNDSKEVDEDEEDDEKQDADNNEEDKKEQSNDSSDDEKEEKKSEQKDDSDKDDKDMKNNQTDEDQEKVEEATVMCMCPHCRKPGVFKTDTHTGEGKCTKCGHWERGNKYLDKNLRMYDSLEEDEDDSSKDDSKKKSDKEDKPKDEPKDEPKDKEEKKPYDDDDGELSDKEKAAAIKDFVNLWKDVLKAMRIETYAEMDLEERAEFWHRMNSGWDKDINPTEFIDQENQEKMENLRITI